MQRPMASSIAFGTSGRYERTGRGVVSRMLANTAPAVVPIERCLPREQFVQHGAERPDVRARIDVMRRPEVAPATCSAGTPSVRAYASSFSASSANWVTLEMPKSRIFTHDVSSSRCTKKKKVRRLEK